MSELTLQIRKWYLLCEETLTNESGIAADGETLHKYVVAVALRNPYAGGYVQDLNAAIAASEGLGREFAKRLRAIAQDRHIESFGKACLVGTAGEYEHGNAFLTTVFAEPLREALGGAKAWMPSTGKRGAPGTVVDIPLAHKDALYVRSHYDTITALFNDAPNADEIVIAVSLATRGRLHARLGGIPADQIQGEDGLV